MRLSNFLVMFSACALFAACANDETPDGNNLSQGNGEQAFIAVRLAAPNAMTRATYEDGSAAESDVDDIRFYFFDNDGKDVSVSGIGTESSVNFITLNASSTPTVPSFDDAGTDVNVDKKATVLVLNNVDLDNRPAKMMVVLNTGDALGNTSLSLSSLKDKAEDYLKDKTSEGKFVMSNSVYMDGNPLATVDAIDVADYISENQSGAETNPVKVYVERVVARVDVKQKSNNNSLQGYTDDTDVAATNINGYQDPSTHKVIANVKGWAIANQNAKSYLIKRLDDKNWNATSPFTGWNDATNHRSYWANTTQLNTGASALATNPDYNSITKAQETTIPNSQYCQELTEITDMDDNPTELNVFAQLTVNNNPTTIARYGGQYYTVDALMSTFLAQLGDIYIKSKEGGSGSTNIDKWTALSADHLKLRPAEDGEDGVAAYEAVLDLQDEFANGDNYEFASNSEGTTSMELSAVEKALNAFTAQLWYNGRTYYHVPITHDTDGATATDPGRFGVVRNHLYNIAISGITGLGTPIPGDTEGGEEDPDDPGKDPIDPEDPEDSNSYLAAEINILSWNVIGQNVELGKD